MNKTFPLGGINTSKLANLIQSTIRRNKKNRTAKPREYKSLGKYSSKSILNTLPRAQMYIHTHIHTYIC